jgi:hypothetical protein
MSDTDGAGTFASNPYDFSTEYGRTGGDVRHRFSLNGSYRGPWGLSFNPMLVMTSGTPFNITIGRDINGDLLFTDRPAIASDLTRSSVVFTRFGNFDTNPLPGAAIIPRNYGHGPGSIITNIRVSKTIGFGTNGRAAQNGRGQQNWSSRPGSAMIVNVVPAVLRGWSRWLPRRWLAAASREVAAVVVAAAGAAARGGGWRVGFGGGESKRYNLTFSMNFKMC